MAGSRLPAVNGPLCENTAIQKVNPHILCSPLFGAFGSPSTRGAEAQTKRDEREEQTMKSGNGEVTQNANADERSDRAGNDHPDLPYVQAGTSGSAQGVRFPPGLGARLRDENERLELWHNHPQTQDAPTDLIPGIDDIVTAMWPGVAAVCVVDNYGNARPIRAGTQRIDCPDAVRPWLSTAATLADLSSGARLEPQSDPVRVRLHAAEATLVAAHEAGLIEVGGVNPPERGGERALGKALERKGANSRRNRREGEGGEVGRERTGALRGTEESTGGRTIEHTSKEIGGQTDDRPGTAWKKDGKYTEEDIARLEAGDLTDPDTCAKLIVAYHENDTATEEFWGFRRDLNVFIPEAHLRAKLAKLDAVANPDARTRTHRMRILSALAIRDKRGIPPQWGWKYEAKDA